MNVDVEIYLKQIFHFFNTNPDQLRILIGEMSKDKFFDKISVKVYEHADKGDELELTKKEMVDLIFDLFTETHKKDDEIKKDPFMKTGYGMLCLN